MKTRLIILLGLPPGTMKRGQSGGGLSPGNIGHLKKPPILVAQHNF